ncbi:hypothetical protein DFH94DRAFT_329096 [Russula ochroleuca]|uniref:Gas1-like protein n=1 Tax=Russula ochroleuca TaxID=152965 RepID=A0A9P5TBQ2_9AGAM|nr:hypothetical protein DFH94DRAFT_329096 [Russula ochroleuca]
MLPLLPRSVSKGTQHEKTQPTQANPCGNINIAQNLDTSATVNALANGTFSASITDFNPGTDGSRSIKTVQVDASGTGNNFVAAQMITNGDPNPTAAGTEQLSVQLPAGIKCTGGTSQTLCLASFITTSGFGNCVVVSQGTGSGNDTVSPSKTGQTTGATNDTNRVASDAAANNGTKSGENTSPSNCTNTGQQGKKLADDDAVANGARRTR